MNKTVVKVISIVAGIISLITGISMIITFVSNYGYLVTKLNSTRELSGVGQYFLTDGVLNIKILLYAIAFVILAILAFGVGKKSMRIIPALVLFVAELIFFVASLSNVILNSEYETLSADFGQLAIYYLSLILKIVAFIAIMELSVLKFKEAKKNYAFLWLIPIAIYSISVILNDVYTGSYFQDDLDPIRYLLFIFSVFAWCIWLLIERIYISAEELQEAE